MTPPHSFCLVLDTPRLLLDSPVFCWTPAGLLLVMSGSLCKTLYSFSSEQHEQGLSFQAGDLIRVLQALPGGWWEGETEDGTRGWFPSSYVQVLEVGPGILELVFLCK